MSRVEIFQKLTRAQGLELLPRTRSQGAGKCIRIKFKIQISLLKSKNQLSFLRHILPSSYFLVSQRAPVGTKQFAPRFPRQKVCISRIPCPPFVWNLTSFDSYIEEIDIKLQVPEGSFLAQTRKKSMCK
jgi:hypothetical protein